MSVKENEERTNADMPGEHLNPDDFNAAEVIEKFSNNNNNDNGVRTSPPYTAGLFEGDIILPPNNGQRSAVKRSQRWPNAIIPYVISDSFDTEERSTIAKAMEAYHEQTCIRFLPRVGITIPTLEDYINIKREEEKGCSSNIGRVGGEQVFNLAEGCVTKGKGRLKKRSNLGLG